MKSVGTRAVFTTVAAIVSAAVTVAGPTFAQVPEGRTTIDADTTLVVRTSEAIDVKSADGLVFTGLIEEDVLDRNGDVAIPEGSTVELLARKSGAEMTLVTFRLARRLNVDVADTGYSRNNRHYHRDYGR